eukprot:gb/GECH01004550.1/.p1 GENE.gb/GECH01004550.1/~~gb/GECH01004550.1/.p1  ORF type:complete len:287 (+),score=72.08 gb/GECH01004550.1/:1-861(+)
MGAYSSRENHNLSEVYLSEMESCTYFTRGEITTLWKFFGNNATPGSMGSDPPELREPYEAEDEQKGITRDVNGWITAEELRSLPAFKENPFTEYFCKIFSTYQDGRLSFGNFLDLASAFSRRASHQVKVKLAFALFDPEQTGKITPRGVVSTLANMLKVSPSQKNQPSNELNDSTKPKPLEESSETSVPESSELDQNESSNPERSKAEDAMMLSDVVSQLFNDNSNEMNQDEFGLMLARIPDIKKKFSVRIIGMIPSDVLKNDRASNIKKVLYRDAEQELEEKTFV